MAFLDDSLRLRLSEVALTLDEDLSQLPVKLADYLQCGPAQITDWSIVRCGIDARRKGRVLRVYTLEFSVANGAALLKKYADDRRLSTVAPLLPTVVARVRRSRRVVVVGMGPAGLFSALWLARAGHQVVIIERGQPLEQRIRDVENFWGGGVLHANSNVQFGEGGAGTFSDGKLTTRIKNPLARQVLQTLVEFGAPEDILLQAKPHIGTDRLRGVLKRFRLELQKLGVEVCFNSCLSDIQRQAAQLVAVTVNDADALACDALVLAIGHSARDTYALLEKKGFRLEAKPFAIGVRVEHPAELINQIQYGLRCHPRLPAADYALAYNDADSGRGIYSFCMCPGGQVVQSSSEAHGVVVNGMSDYRRASAFSNSALVVAVRPDDFGDTSPLAGIRFQQYWEQQAFIAGGGNYRPPAQNMLAFLGQRGGSVHSSCRPEVQAADLSEVLPAAVVSGLRRALPQFERKMRGFITAEATLIGIESRTSAPLRILRDGSGQAPQWGGVYPAGEGAGYAGGIMSAAIDGISAALAISRHGEEGGI